MRSSSDRIPRRCPVCRDPFVELDADGYVDCGECGRVPASRKAILAEARAELDRSKQEHTARAS